MQGLDMNQPIREDEIEKMLEVICFVPIKKTNLISSWKKMQVIEFGMHLLVTIEVNRKTPLN